MKLKLIYRFWFPGISKDPDFDWGKEWRRCVMMIKLILFPKHRFSGLEQNTGEEDG